MKSTGASFLKMRRRAPHSEFSSRTPRRALRSSWWPGFHSGHVKTSAVVHQGLHAALRILAGIPDPADPRRSAVKAFAHEDGAVSVHARYLLSLGGSLAAGLLRSVIGAGSTVCGRPARGEFWHLARCR